MQSSSPPPHYILNGHGLGELYDVQRDPRQEQNLIETAPEETMLIRAKFERARGK